MYDFSFDCQNSLAGHAALRAELASLMDDFERQHGPVITEPILIRCDSPSYNNRIMSNARARKRGCDAQRKPTPLAKRGTRQAKKNAVLREVWP
nr:hypothetical protein [Gammaproteobacteria bacterium]